MRFLKRLIFRFVLPVGLTILGGLAVSLYLVDKLNIKNSLINIVLNRPFEVNLAGTGSMYPTLYWDEKLGGPEAYDNALKENKFRVLPEMYYHLYFPNRFRDVQNPKVDIGDIVSFTIPSHDESYIKRVAGLPNDTILIRDGYLYRNGERVSEPYTLKPRSTFGGDNVPECQELKVPKNKVLILGDNRKLSLDSRSREIGFVDLSQIDFVLPFKDQTAFHNRWRQTSENEADLSKPVLDSSALLSKINELRISHNLPKLFINAKLTASSNYRANEILSRSVFSSSEDKSHFSEIMKNFGYENVLTAEYYIQGYYDETEIISLRLESDALNSLLLEKNYSDIGVSSVNKELNGCPTQLTVLHFGGYIPASYEEEAIRSWRESYDNIINTSRSWKEARGDELVNQEQLEELLRKYERLIEIASHILNKMENRLWLNESDQGMINEFNLLVEEVEELSTSLNADMKSKADEIRRKNYQTCIENWELFVTKKEDCEKFR